MQRPERVAQLKLICVFNALVVAACAGIADDSAPVTISPSTAEARAITEKILLTLEREEKRINWPHFQNNWRHLQWVFLR